MNTQMHKSLNTQPEESELKFHCPVCGCNEFEIVETGVVAFSPILKVTATGGAQYSKTLHDYTNVEEKWYECARCDYRLEIDGDTISAPDDKLLLAWFRINDEGGY